MKAYIKFDFPDDKEDFDLHMNASKFYCALSDISAYRRSLNKYEEREAIPKEELIDKLAELLLDVSDYL